jgi:hypothetical protein
VSARARVKSGRVLKRKREVDLLVSGAEETEKRHVVLLCFRASERKGVTKKCQRKLLPTRFGMIFKGRL